MSELFDVEVRWPELFVALAEAQLGAVRSALVGGWHEGWTPNREDVADLVEYARGDISLSEYRQRTDAKVANLAATQEQG